LDELILFEKIKHRDREAYNILFRKYYTALCCFSHAICLSQEDAEENVQDMFVHFWETAPAIEITTSIKAYLYMSARNYTLNSIKKRQTEIHHISEYSDYDNGSEADDKISDAEISTLIRKGVDTLPEKCREIFILCKLEGLTYDEISEYLDISKKTVDNQMGIALRKLREFLNIRLRKLPVISLFYLFFWG